MAAYVSGLGGFSGLGFDAGDFLARYRQVLNKLKKRFLRKPNVAEAGEQFGQLGRELRAQECLPYAAWCQLAVARCHQARDYNGALAVFTRMQRLAQEHGSHPVQPQPPPLPLQPQSHPPLQPPQLGPQLLPGGAPPPPPAQSPPNTSFATATSGALLGAFWEVVVRCEVSRVLLLLLLQPPPAKLLREQEHAHTLEKYSWEAFDSHGQETSGQLPEELFLLLQSLVMATHEKDTEAVKSLQVEMWPLLSAEQNHLLHLVLQEIISPSGQGI
ncbi:PREDICTED: factor VIII intron 22 protein-like [Miniopterus natalensis]|uniref:factor VIII intron 22 protein-like n=1 Tax=Miniopterus natalensis TaxID=291302 RepID=UPI0007A712E9|nr:PREDICTED: factor VIII intron 22 protein-like [Miniopterus natalensis]